MQLLPNLENNRPLAISLLVIVLVLVYFIGFHWFVMRHVDLANQVDSLEERAARFKAAVARRPGLEGRLEELQAERLDSALFLPESNFNVAAAGLTRRLRDIIQREADDADLCRIESTTNRPDSEPERFEQVTVNVRMNCPLPDLTRILYEVEDNVPLIFVDNLIINQRVPADRAGRRGSRGYGQLDVRFDIYGFLSQPVVEED
ncbi:type II secretion system protein GspM [Wenzhouxiangella sp. EGI_FJ10305]|uniref:type II secretion system protein GspM n=1 Tax=Wenzhouxiangella sp. EGI_FJ10305 TaxID=3243768 RepID=UPI0035D653F1